MSPATSRQLEFDFRKLESMLWRAISMPRACDLAFASRYFEMSPNS